MKKVSRIVTISFYILSTISLLWIMISYGFNYYTTPTEERFFNVLHNSLKPSGLIGHGYGIIGTLLILIGVSFYMLRKRFRVLSRMGLLKHWLEFHIYLCTIGPLLILFHTAFKFGGIVAISFWSMAAVFLSGILGRFIYLQIPRSIHGNELTFEELQLQNKSISQQITNKYQIDSSILNKIETIADIASYKSIKPGNVVITIAKEYFSKKAILKEIKEKLTSHNIDGSERKEILKLSASKLTLVRKIGLLSAMQKLFNYWHIIHLPFALIMLIIMVIHVAVTIVFGYKWIF